MPFREKTAWMSLVTTLAVWGYYFVAVVRALRSGAPDGGALLGLFVGCVILLTVVQIIVSVVLAILSPGAADAPADERERAISLKAIRNAFVTLNALALVIALSSPALALIGPYLFPANPLSGTVIVLASAIFFAVVLAELVRSAGQIFYFHRVG
jgi:hypothetical protein